MSPMTAQVTINTTEIELKPTRALPRWLRVTSYTGTRLNVCMTSGRDRFRNLAFACAPIADCYIQATGPALWIGSASFDVTEEQAARLRETFSLSAHPADEPRQYPSNFTAIDRYTSTSREEPGDPVLVRKPDPDEQYDDARADQDARP
jgi:hypothetical protein